ncbi:MAG: DNA repair protein RecO [Oscillospiraceae bacterium]|nr:DNA repair protein RecO [Oscillospiraceae bacterium]
MQTQALTLRASPLKENDRLITVLTEQHGLMRAFANGARRPKSPLHAATQPFAYGQMQLAQRRDTYTLREAQADGVFFAGLAADITRLALANYFAALCIEFCPQQEPAPEQLRLLMNALHYLCEGTRPQLLLKAVVELRLLCLAGYAPDVPTPAVRAVCDLPLVRAFKLALPEDDLRRLARFGGDYAAKMAGRRFEELTYYQELETA